MGRIFFYPGYIVFILNGAFSLLAMVEGGDFNTSVDMLIAVTTLLVAGIGTHLFSGNGSQSRQPRRKP